MAGPVRLLARDSKNRCETATRIIATGQLPMDARGPLRTALPRRQVARPKGGDGGNRVIPDGSPGGYARRS